jgi:MFS family permease
MTPTRLAKLCSGRLHYAWIVLAVTFLASLTAVGVRAAPGVMIVPLQRAFGWDVGTISGAISVNILLLGLLGPFITGLMDTFGLKRTLLCCMAMLVAATGLSVFMTEPWQLFATWGVMVGIGASAGAIGLATAIANRWFHTNRGLAMGLLTAANAAGQLVFLPVMAALSQAYGWQAIAIVVSLTIAAMLPVVWLLLPESPAEIGLAPYGGTAERAMQPTAGNPFVVAMQGLSRGVRSVDFWLLTVSFAICGLSTNGLVGTHLVAYCVDNGFTEVAAAGFLATLGIFNLMGSALSGWLTDRYNPRLLMFWLFAIRGLSLFVLPLTGFDMLSLSLFTVFYGLNWIAIVPPMFAVINEVFGRKSAPVIISWVFAGHQVGGAIAAYGAGAIRDVTGSYLLAFVASGVACLLAAILVMRVARVEPAALAAE